MSYGQGHRCLVVSGVGGFNEPTTPLADYSHRDGILRQRALLVLVPALPLDHEHFVLGLPAIDYAHTGGFLLAGGPLDAKECHSDFEPDSLDTREALDDADNLVVRLHNAKHMSAGNRRKAKAWEATYRSGAHFFRWKVAGSDSRGFCRRGKLVGL